MIISNHSVAERNQIVNEYRQLISDLGHIGKKIRQMKSDTDLRREKLENDEIVILRKIDKIIDAYWNWIPEISLSQCPFCNKELCYPFDPVDLKGFWWMDRTQRPFKKPQFCEHFNLILGAVNLNGLPPEGGPFESRPGPDVPYIIPRILEMPTMVAVISSIEMDCGYTAYPIAYYSEIPPVAGSLTQSWARKEYYFTLDNGKSGWDIVSDSYDFDLLPWLKADKISLFQNGRIITKKNDLENHPFMHVKGARRSQSIINDELSFSYDSS
ncbi:hypothetical protein ACLHDG_05125 [Sulfurovum sp. CS9]|uniref:hypothetical protein n=1 Tax=Sulfurovum sp. CS9 TaxID=3391146 RepID=UPI0039E7AA0B